MEAKQIRNFVIISHIDHGKSTLADRFLELNGTVPEKKMRPQFLDMMDLERERGITIKMQPVRMIYNSKYILNLIDTPGHADFSYEVSRALAAVEGAILLVDASKGIQAQTLANLELAKEQGLVIIPAVNKIDLAQSKIEETSRELADLLEIKEEEILKISAKTGANVKELLDVAVRKIPYPGQKEEEIFSSNRENKPLRALVFDSKYDSYKGVIAYVRVMDGKIEKGEKIKFLATEAEGEAKEIGFFNPEPSPQNNLSAGEIGYIASGIKEAEKIRVGDTIVKLKIKNKKLNITENQISNIKNQELENVEVKPLPGYKELEPMVFASLYPESGGSSYRLKRGGKTDDFDLLKEGLERLKLNDPSLTFEPETKEGLGRGFRCGFLGALHAEIVSERLKREFNLSLVISSPSVVYKIIRTGGREKFIYSPSDWPDPSDIERAEEPWVLLKTLTPNRYIGPLSEIFKKIEGEYLKTEYLGQEKTILFYQIPLREIIANLYDKIKSLSQGYASMNYKVMGWRTADLVKMEVLIAGEKEEAFSKIILKRRGHQEGKLLVEKIKKSLPPQQFAVALQAVVGGKIVARETVKARRKNVTASLYGGDVTRKRKLLEKQKKGKKKLKERGKIRIPPEVFLEVFRG